MPLVVFVKPCEILNRSPFPEASLANSYTVAIAEGGIQYDMRVWSPEENSGWPIRECPDVRASVPSSSLFIATKGRLFRHGSICARSVTISSKVSLVSPMTHLGCVFALLTLSTASHRPPKCRPVQVWNATQCSNWNRIERWCLEYSYEQKIHAATSTHDWYLWSCCCCHSRWVKGTLCEQWTVLKWW